MKAIILCVILALMAAVAAGGYALAKPSADFHKVGNDVSDDWGICRNRAFGNDGFYQLSESGFRPVIAFESLGEHADSAYRLGEQVAQEDTDNISRAETIFYFVRDRVNYTPDTDQFEYDEFAQNADELLQTIIREGVGRGDCEDSAVLLAVMYRGAGLRSAIAIGEEHTAALVFLPEYRKASAVFTINDEPGWVWSEATGRKNPLGWVPKDYVGKALAAYEIIAEPVTTEPPPAPATAVSGKGEEGGGSFPFPFIGIMFLLWLIPMFRRKRAR